MAINLGGTVPVRAGLKVRIPQLVRWPRLTTWQAPALRPLKILIEHGATADAPAAYELSRYAGHPLVEVWSTDPSSPNCVTIGALDQRQDMLGFRFDTKDSRGTGGVPNLSSYYAGIPRLIALRIPASEADLHEVVHVFAVAAEMGVDVIVTDGLLLDLRGFGMPGLRGSTILTAEEALALVGLKLRGEEEIKVPWGDGPHFCIDRPKYYRMTVPSLTPALPMWHRRCYHVGPPAVERAVASVWVRLRHTLRARDEIQHETQLREVTRLETVMYHLDMLLVSLVGAFDGTALVANDVLGVGAKPQDVGWWKDGWVGTLPKQAAPLGSLVAKGTTGRACLTCLVELRNFVHGDVMKSWHMHDGPFVRFCFEIPEREGRKPDHLVRDHIWEAAESSGGAAAWGLERGPREAIYLHPGLYVEQLLDSSLVLLNALMAATVVALPRSAEALKPPPQPRMFHDDIHRTLCYLTGVESGIP